MRIPKTISGFSEKKALLTFIMAVGLIANAYSQGSREIDSLENIITGTKEDSSLVIRLRLLSNEYLNRGEYDRAFYYADTALSLARKIGWKKGEIQAFIFKGVNQNSLSDYTNARISLHSALRISEEINYNLGKAYANIHLGNVYKDQGDYHEAVKYFSAGLAIASEIGDTNVILSAYNGFGLVYEGLGNFPEALNYYFAYLKVAEKSGDKRRLSIAYNNIGIIYAQQGNSEEALKLYNEALKSAEETGNKGSLSRTYNNIGIIYGDMENNSEALKYYLLSLKIKEEIGDREGAASTYGNIGGLYAELEDLSLAEKNYLAALKIYEEIGSKEGLAMVYNYLGKLYTRKAEYNKARKFIKDGLELMHEVGNKDKLKMAYRALYKLDSAEGRFPMALEHYKIYKLYEDSLLGEESNLKTTELKLQYETEKKDQEIELLNKDNEIKSLQLSKQKAIRHGMIAGIILLFLAGFFLFRSFRLRKKLEQQQAIISERRRISADLHDDVGSGLSRIMLLTELVRNEAKTPEMKQEAEKIAAISKDLSANISEIIWALNANNDKLESLVAYIRRYAAEFFEDAAVKLKISTPVGIAKIPLSGEKRRDIFYTVKEALHNIMKHSGATEAELSFTLNEGELAVEIRDNGRGIQEETSKVHGNGLNNMRQRMEDVGGRFVMENHQGTKITLRVPVP